MLSNSLRHLSVLLLMLIYVPLAAANMTGSKAPAFEMPDQDGKLHKLSDYQGNWVVLYFYPKDHTSGCTVEAGEFRDNKTLLDNMNAVVMGVSVDGVESHKSFHDDLKLNFDLLSDKQKIISKAYNVLNDLVVISYSRRQTFIIDPLGMIAHHFEDVDPDTHATEVISKLSELQKIYAR